MSNEIGTLIKQARIQKGYTQEALADLVGVQKSAVAKWENGRVTEIKRSNLIRLADILGIEDVLLVGNAYDGKNENPTAGNDGISEEKRELIARIQELTDDQIQLLLQVAKSIK